MQGCLRKEFWSQLVPIGMVFHGKCWYLWKKKRLKKYLCEFFLKYLYAGWVITNIKIIFAFEINGNKPMGLIRIKRHGFKFQFSPRTLILAYYLSMTNLIIGVTSSFWIFLIVCKYFALSKFSIFSRIFTRLDSTKSFLYVTISYTAHPSALLCFNEMRWMIWMLVIFNKKNILFCSLRIQQNERSKLKKINFRIPSTKMTNIIFLSN